MNLSYHPWSDSDFEICPDCKTAVDPGDICDYCGYCFDCCICDEMMNESTEEFDDDIE